MPFLLYIIKVLRKDNSDDYNKIINKLVQNGKDKNDGIKTLAWIYDLMAQGASEQLSLDQHPWLGVPQLEWSTLYQELVKSILAGDPKHIIDKITQAKQSNKPDIILGINLMIIQQFSHFLELEADEES